MTPEMIPNVYDVVNDFDNAEQGKTDNLGQKAIEVTKNINGGQGYVITAERGTRKAEIKTALKRKQLQVPDVKNSEQNVRNAPATAFTRNIPQSEQDNKPKYSIGANNSDESTLQRIRNKAAAWFSGRKALSERRNKRIVQRINFCPQSVKKSRTF